jgi:hypothetical protein
MTTQHDDTLSDSRRWQLRALRQDVEPRRDLWPGIAARITETPQVRPGPASPRRPSRIPVMAAAAMLALAIGLGWQLRPDGPVAGHGSQPPALLSIEAEAMAREYQAALGKVEAARGIEEAPPPLAELDASAEQIRHALAQAPDSRFLFEKLQRVYAQRLSLTQRIPLG